MGKPCAEPSSVCCVSVIFRRSFGEPIINLVVQNIEHTRVIPDENDETFTGHYKRPNHVKCGHCGRSYARLKRSAFTDHLAQATYGQDALYAVLIYGDLGAAAENNDNSVPSLAFSYERGVGSERPPGRYRTALSASRTRTR